MSKSRIFLILAGLSLLLVALAVSRVSSDAAKSTDSNLSSRPRPIIVPVTGANDVSDYAQRHPELSVRAGAAADTNADFYLRHPEWAGNVRNAAVPVTGVSDASDYFLRHREGNAAGVAAPLTESLERPGMACESPVDCR